MRTEFKYQVRQFLVVVAIAVILMGLGGWIDAI